MSPSEELPQLKCVAPSEYDRPPTRVNIETLGCLGGVLFFVSFPLFCLAFYLGTSPSWTKDVFYHPGVMRTLVWTVQGITQFGAFIGWAMCLTHVILSSGKKSVRTTWPAVKIVTFAAVAIAMLTFVVVVVMGVNELLDIRSWH